MRPPMRSRASSTSTEHPDWPSAPAAASPAAPAPITMTSWLSTVHRDDDAGAAPVAPVSLGPVDEHDQAIAEADEEIDVRGEPDPPREGSGEPDAPEVDDRGHAADGGEGAEVACSGTGPSASRRSWRGSPRPRSGPSASPPARSPAPGLPSVRNGREVADDEHFRMPGTRARGVTGTRPARSHARRPSVAPSGEAATPAAQNTVRAPTRSFADTNTARIELRDRLPRAHLDAEPLELPPRLLRERGREGRQHARTRLDQQNSRRRRIDVAELALEGVARDLRQCAGQLHAGGARPRRSRNVSHSIRSAGSSVASARSNAVRIRARMRKASSSVFSPGAYRAHSS